MIKAVIFDILNVIFTSVPDDPFTYQLTDEMQKLLWKLEENGIVIGYLTNGSGTKLDELVDSGQLPKFKIKISSIEACFTKPDPEIYGKLATELENREIKLEETIYIDDKVQNLQPAERIGIVTHNFTNFNSLKEFLDKQNVTAE